MKKQILITGSTDGIGKLSAIRLAKEGHSVYVHGRSEARVKATVAKIKADSGNENVSGFVADFSDLNAVNQMAQQIKAQLPKLDILINNAGIFKTAESLNSAGLDLRFVVNYLAPYLLTEALLNLMEQSGKSRIINLSSAAQAEVSYEAMVGNRSISLNESYAQSKLALTMWSFHLSRALKNTTVIAVNPGSLLNTKMANEAYGQHWSPAEKGVNILCDLALSDEYESITGKYFDNDSGGFAEAHTQAYDDAAIERLMDFTKKLTD